ncbi:MAG: ABC transporter substrate-binding protein [Thermomicrobiales bacterium]|nr:ABC transporter substrate-binding protein [Thermomicrobiales bacterium]
MIKNVSRRSFIKGAAGAAAVGAASSRFFAPTMISAQGSGVELIYWHAFNSGANGEAQTKLIEDFNALGNGVTVVPTGYANYEEVANAILTGLDSGDVPHIATLSDVWWFSFYLRQALVELSPFAENPDDYIASLFGDYTRNGGQWGVPFARSTPIFYYNVEAFDAAGVDPAVVGKWSDFAGASASLVDASDVTYSFGFGNAASYGAWTMHGAVWAFDGRYSDEDFNILINKEGSVAAGEFMRDMVQTKKAGTVDNPTNEFIAGTLAAMIGSTGSLGTITKDGTVEFKTAKLPEEIKFGCPTGGTGLSIIAGATDEQQQAAATFMNFCTNTENASFWSQYTGYMPVRTSAIESEDYQAFLAEHPNNQVAIEQLPLTQPQDSARVFIPNGDANIGKAWEQILVNNTPAQQAFDEVAALLEEDKAPVIEALSAIEG